VSDLALLPLHLAAGMGIVDLRTEAIQSIEELEAFSSADAKLTAPRRTAFT